MLRYFIIFSRIIKHVILIYNETKNPKIPPYYFLMSHITFLLNIFMIFTEYFMIFDIKFNTKEKNLCSQIDMKKSK